MTALWTCPGRESQPPLKDKANDAQGRTHKLDRPAAMLCGQSSVITHQHRISQHREADVTITCRIMQGHDTCAAELGNNSKLSSCAAAESYLAKLIDTDPPADDTYRGLLQLSRISTTNNDFRFKGS